MLQEYSPVYIYTITNPDLWVENGALFLFGMKNTKKAAPPKESAGNPGFR